MREEESSSQSSSHERIHVFTDLNTNIHVHSNENISDSDHTNHSTTSNFHPIQISFRQLSMNPSHREFFDENGMDRNWYVEMHRRRLQRLLSTSLVICFLILAFDNNTGLSRRRKHSIHSNTLEQHYNKTEIKNNLDQLNYLLHLEHPLNKLQISLNASGIYSGHWKQITKAEYDMKMDSSLSKRIQPFLKGYISSSGHNTAIHRVPKGSMWLFLQMKSTSVKRFDKDLSYITGQVILHDEKSTFASTIFPVQGVLFRHSGHLTLFGNRQDGHVQLIYPNSMNTTNQSINSSNTTSEQSQLTYEVTPTTLLHRPYRRPSRFRGQQSVMSQSCRYRLDLSVPLPDRKPIQEDEEISKHPVLDGVLSSDNCGLYMNVSAVYEDEDLHKFYSKASHYAMAMTLISMFQLLLLLRQVQNSSTQAAASKISLITIGQQAILDSYLCLAHLTAGIVAQSIFTAFATVAFFKLIIFSIFEMRYLLLIWKARRPQTFAEGWNSARRELTVLYSRFYCTLLIGIFLIYDCWSQMNFLVLLAYSFWIPQIVHTAHREVRNPLNWQYLFGMSTSRLFLPLYIYGCPSNFLTAFPMYRYKPNNNMCWMLTIWMLVQVGVILLQQRWGPRFFIPARFLPVKYNYERRIDPQQLSLIRSTNEDGIDCVICMVDIDLEARDYMIAPCDHIFHRECLQGWMDVKMECPTCRMALPEP